MKVIPGTVQSCSHILKEGNLLAISPGGVYESQFSHQYDLLWRKRVGFAKVAMDAKVVSFCIFIQTCILLCLSFFEGELTIYFYDHLLFNTQVVRSVCLKYFHF